jgi:formate-dependent nitrite reductase membrane component NrfD
MTYNVRNIAIALVLAGIAAFLVIMYTGNVQKQAKDSQQATSVLVATADIPAVSRSRRPCSRRPRTPESPRR